MGDMPVTSDELLCDFLVGDNGSASTSAVEWDGCVCDVAGRSGVDRPVPDATLPEDDVRARSSATA